MERARVVLSERDDKRGVAFLSFTNAAISELQERLTHEGLLSAIPFPHFVGTFDRFIWNFLVAPFGLEGCQKPLRLIPDKESLIVKPFPSAQSLPLRCFERETGSIVDAEARKHGFNRDPRAHQTTASRLRERLLERGQLDFLEVRHLAAKNLENPEFAKKLAQVLRARFKEIIVDEAQDCNPEDLSIVGWLRDTARVATKVICDPHQSIYGFRDGVAEELFDFCSTFQSRERLPLSGNFRSTEKVCRAVHSLRSPTHRGNVDAALGPLKDMDVPIHILGYAGSGVSPKIGEMFQEVVEEQGLGAGNCPVVAKVHRSAMKAAGFATIDIGQSLSQRLANASMRFQCAQSPKQRLDAIVQGHKIALEIAGKTGEGTTYHQALVESELDGVEWRGQITKILKALEFDPDVGHTRSEWLGRARRQFDTFLSPGGRTIAQLLRSEVKLDSILGTAEKSKLVARTIHSVKGLEFPGICVVMTSSTSNGILAHLESEPDQSKAESAREIYVAASRAETLLAIACPQNQSERLENHLTRFGATCKRITV